jgi:hypothetical protein
VHERVDEQLISKGIYLLQHPYNANQRKPTPRHKQRKHHDTTSKALYWMYRAEHHTVLVLTFACSSQMTWRFPMEMDFCICSFRSWISFVISPSAPQRKRYKLEFYKAANFETSFFTL